ncbi:hypothetical protein BDN72DRAFT_832470 [Pluteus cervinus]|uniref:Uncharacterized protein n=1 Tax=Pluteus cervinus TaxID=181527 RepID=A0ACD3BBR9_9AGAR|nr:hypothetical protein BDN72DRAFT_832470 [Pluteus cervinus]
MKYIQHNRQPARYKAKIPGDRVEVLLLQYPTRPRTTRPPVPKSDLQVYPYAKQTTTTKVETKCKACPVIDALPMAKLSPGRRRRKRKGNSVHKQRPPAQFWRPKAGLRGKCHGYAMGYPGSSSECAAGYIRDTMRKGLHASTMFV